MLDTLAATRADNRDGGRHFRAMGLTPAAFAQRTKDKRPFWTLLVVA
jgi:hypothetical protein